MRCGTRQAKFGRPPEASARESRSAAGQTARGSPLERGQMPFRATADRRPCAYEKVRDCNGHEVTHARRRELPRAKSFVIILDQSSSPPSSHHPERTIQRLERRRRSQHRLRVGKRLLQSPPRHLLADLWHPLVHRIGSCQASCGPATVAAGPAFEFGADGSMRQQCR
jgi:hypothetical protein